MVSLPALQRAQAYLRTLTAGLLAAMLVVVGTVSWVLAGWPGLAISAAILVLGWRAVVELSPIVVMRFFRGVPNARRDSPELAGMVADLARRSGLPTVPRLFYLPQTDINAVAVGAGTGAALGVSHGALRRLTWHEMRGVLAHEMAHLASGDANLLALSTLIAEVTRSLAIMGLFLGAVVLIMLGPDSIPLGFVLFLGMVSPVVVGLHLALARTREFAADLQAVATTGDPLGLAQALFKIEQMAKPRRTRGLARLPIWLRTHPQTTDRVAAILHIARTGVAPPVWQGGWHTGTRVGF